MKIKILVAVVAAFTLSGCYEVHIDVEDNGPDEYEREDAWKSCTGEPTFNAEAVDVETRIACTAAVYGGN